MKDLLEGDEIGVVKVAEAHDLRQTGDVAGVVESHALFQHLLVQLFLAFLGQPRQRDERQLAKVHRQLDLLYRTVNKLPSLKNTVSDNQSSMLSVRSLVVLLC